MNPNVLIVKVTEVSVGLFYLQVVDQQLIQGRVSVQIDEETFVFTHFDPRSFQRNTHALQLLLTLL